MSTAREKIGQRCEFCAHYESQMHAAQASERQALVLLRAVERQLELERQAMNKQQNYITELESNLQTVSEQTSQQVCLCIIHNATYCGFLKVFRSFKVVVFEFLKFIIIDSNPLYG